MDEFLRKLQAWWRSLFAAPAPPEPPPPTGWEIQPVERKVLAILFDPLVPSHDNQPLSKVMRWNDPEALMNAYIQDLQTVSGGYVRYTLTERITTHAFPVKADGFRYTPEEYLAVIRGEGSAHQPDWLDYHRLVADFNLVERVNRGDADEIWLMGYPYAGFYESRMAGPGAFWCNAPALENAGSFNRRVILMGFNLQRGVGEMLEAFGHRAESILQHVYSTASGTPNFWERFTRYDKSHRGQAEVGSVHYAPNSRTDYEWGNPTPVLTRCRTWNDFPQLRGEAVTVGCAEWGGGDIRQHHLWWLGYFPRQAGFTGSVANNWWLYVIDPNQVR